MHRFTLSAATLVASLAVASAAHAHIQLVTVTMSGQSYEPGTIDLLAGSDYQLHLVNASGRPQDFSAPELFAAGTVAPGDRAKVKDGAVEVDQGASVDIRFVPTKKGSYKLRSTSSGATGTATVE